MKWNRCFNYAMASWLRVHCLLKPRVFGDDRGFFFESWNKRAFQAALVEGGWSRRMPRRLSSFRTTIHDPVEEFCEGFTISLSLSPKESLCVAPLGAIFDVAVDLRRSSKTLVIGWQRN